MYEPRAETMAQGSPKLLTRRRQRLGHADYPLDRGVPGTALGYFRVAWDQTTAICIQLETKELERNYMFNSLVYLLKCDRSICK